MNEQNEQSILEIAQGVAHWLGPEWTAEQPEGCYWAHLKAPGNVQLGIHTIWNKKDRLEVSGSYPTGHDGYRYGTGYGEKNPVISVSKARGAAIVAGEIKRRILPEYLPLLEKVLARKRQDEEHARRKAAMLASFGQILETAPGENKVHFHTADGISGEVEPWYDGTATLKLSGLPAALEEQVLHLVRP